MHPIQNAENPKKWKIRLNKESMSSSEFPLGVDWWRNRMRLADGTSGFSWKKKRDVSVVGDSRALGGWLGSPGVFVFSSFWHFFLCGNINIFGVSGTSTCCDGLGTCRFTKGRKGTQLFKKWEKKHPNRVGKNSSGKLCVWNTIKIKKERVNEGRRIYFYLVKE